MLNANTLLNQLSFVQRSLGRLRRLGRLSLDEFMADEDNSDLAQHHLRIATEAAVDMGRHIIARMGWGQPTSYVDVFTRLGAHSVLSRNLATRCEELARFRNLLVHQYPLVTAQEAYQRVLQHLSDIEEFVTEMTAYLQTQGIP